MKRASVLVLVFLLAVGIYSCKDAGTTDGKALFKIRIVLGKKDCQVQRTGKTDWIDAKTLASGGLFLYQGDLVRTGKETQVILEMPNGGTCMLKPETTLTVVQPKDGQNEQSISKVILKIIHGTGLFSVNKAPPKYHVTTEHAVTGVLGTKFMVQCGDKDSKISVLEGKVNCDDNDDGEDEDKDKDSKTCTPRTSVTVGADGSVSAPTPLSISELSTLTDYFKELEGLVIGKPWYRGGGS